MAESTDAARTMKRRGILAAAGAVVAGIAAKHAARPVTAVSGNALLIGSTNVPTLPQDTTRLAEISSSEVATVLFRLDNFSNVRLDPAPSTRSALFAVTAGVDTTTGTKIGVQSAADSGIGVYGSSLTGIGAWGQSGGSGGTGVYGFAGGAAGVGIYGYAPGGIGVYGVTNTAGNYGVLGTAGATANATAIAGQATGTGASAFSGGNPNVNGFAAYFDGHVQVNGPFDVIGAGNKHAAVAHPDGSHRTIYSIEAAEAWVEDFGTGTLAGGKADVKMDPDFAALIHTDDYHVFLTEHDQHNALHVSSRTAGGFIVQADTATAAAKGKKASDLTGTFSWRIVARPQTTAKVGRLAKVTLADAKALLPDPTKLPKPQKPLDMPPLTKRGA